MDHCIETDEILDSDVADVTPDIRGLPQGVTEGTAAVEVSVESDDIDPALLEHRNEDSADVASVSSYQDTHTEGNLP
jgi:hypothetical protein